MARRSARQRACLGEAACEDRYEVDKKRAAVCRVTFDDAPETSLAEAQQPSGVGSNEDIRCTQLA